MSASLEDMAERAESLAAKFSAARTFEEARAALNEARMLQARRSLEDALAGIEAAQLLARETAAVVDVARAQLEQATAEAEWELDGRFVVEGAKTFLVDGDTKRPMTADARKDWKANEARKNPAVAAAAERLRDATQTHAEAKDRVAFSEKRFQAARADLDAAIATVGVLAASIRKEAN